MSQTSVIAGTLVVAYIVFITVKGDLPVWMAMLGVGSSNITCGQAGGGSGGGGGGTCTWNDPTTWLDCLTVNPTKA